MVAISKYQQPTETADLRVVENMSFENLVRMGDVLVKTGFLPDPIRTGGQVAAIILAGRELGMPPMRALRSLILVKGQVVEKADSQLARFKAQGGHASFVTLDDTKAVLRMQLPNGDVHTETFTINDAKRAGLTGDNWRNYPKAMLRSRAITAGLKSLGWEGAVGAYDPDEIQTIAAEPAPAPEPVVEQPQPAAKPEAPAESVGRAQQWATAFAMRLSRLETVEQMQHAVDASAERLARLKIVDPVTFSDLSMEIVQIMEGARQKAQAGSDSGHD